MLPRPLLVLLLLHGAVVARLGVVAQVVVDDPGRVLVDDLALAGALVALVLLPSAYGSGTVVLLMLLLPVVLLMVVVLLVMDVVLVEGCRRVVAAEGGRRAGGAR